MSTVGIRDTEESRRLYGVWNNMRHRCYDKKDDSYKNYGGRGIEICNEWLHSFKAFYTWAINNGYKIGLTIDRRDNNGNYEPSNCRWVTMKVQNNNRRDNLYVTINGEKRSISEWCDIYGTEANVHTVIDRIKRQGIDPEIALTMDKKIVGYRVTIDGETHSVKEWCKIKGLVYQTILDRIRAGTSPFDAITVPVTHHIVTIGNETHTLADWCRLKGLNYDTIIDRITRHGMDPVTALTKGVTQKTGDITINGETHSVPEWCKLLGLSYQTVASRIRKGMSPVEALTTPVKSKRK